MALNRRLFGGGAADWAFTSASGVVTTAPATVIQFYSALTGGILYGPAPLPGGTDDGTGLLDNTGAPVASVVTDANGEIPQTVYGPSGIYAMAADGSGGAGPRRWLYASDMGSDLLALLGQQNVNNAALAFLNSTAPVYNYYNLALPGYPPRPATGAPVWWVGPVAPAFGGTAAIDGLDFYLGPQA